ncbi:hypothetical protein ABZY34_16610, partial [Streptomyces virginiae]
MAVHTGVEAVAEVRRERADGTGRDRGQRPEQEQERDGVRDPRRGLSRRRLGARLLALGGVLVLHAAL